MHLVYFSPVELVIKQAGWVKIFVVKIAITCKDVAIIYIYIYSKLATIVEGDLKAPFSIAYYTKV